MAGKGSFPKPLVYFFVGLILLNLLSGLASDPDFAEDFPLFAAIGAFLLFRFFTSRNGNRRGPVPMPRPVPEPTAQEPPKDLGFKIPPLKGAPKDALRDALRGALKSICFPCSVLQAVSGTSSALTISRSGMP